MRRAAQTAVIEEVTVARIGHRGDGVAETADGAVYVPFALPGERLRIARSGGRGEVREILASSPQRVAPVCRHFGACGGCRLQHWQHEPYLAWQQAQVVAALAARGFNAEVAPVVAGKTRTRRRTVLSARSAAAGVVLGYHAPASGEVIAVTECPVLTPALESALAPLARLVACAGPFRGEARLTVTDSEAGADIAIAGPPAPEGPETMQAVANIATQAGFARLTWGGETLFQRAVPAQVFAGVTVLPPPGAFLQATAAGETALADLVLAATAGAQRVADLFAGCGTFALRLARRAQVTAVEADEAALTALDRAARAPGLKPVACIARDLYRAPLLPAELATFNAVILDPPFAGARAQAETLAASGVGRIVMVSCNPATFARDARILADGGYRLEQVQAVDQFVFSPHIELVGAFARREGA